MISFKLASPKVPSATSAISLDILEGDIAAQAVDALVNAANDRLWMGAGVAGALKAKGGEEIEREAMAQGPVRRGQAVVTGAGRLPARHVIHAVVMGQDLRTDAGLIAEATANALAAAESLGLRSIAFPALGTGVGGFPLDECARIMIETIRAQVEQPGSLERVVLVLFGRPAYDAFADVARDMLE